MSHEVNASPSHYLAFKNIFTNVLVEWIANKFECSIDKVDPQIPFVEFGLDSISTAQMLNVLEEHTKQSLEIHLTKDYKNIAELSAYLAERETMEEVEEESFIKDIFASPLSLVGEQGLKIALPEF